MVIDQRNAGASVTVNTALAFYATDRFRLSGVSSSGVFTGQQISDAPVGFNNSLRVTVTTTDSSLTGADLYYAVHNIEGFNIADLGWGTANAKSVTISFWVKSSVTGTFGGALSNNSVTRSYPFTYTINSANTWEQKSITISGDTTGTWETTNSNGIRMYYGLGIASGFAGTAGAWSASQLLSATGSVNLMATNGATWQVTGVQLEVGTQATSFEYRQYGTELALCQRYFERSDSVNTSLFWSGYVQNAQIVYMPVKFAVTKRANVTVTFSNISNAGFPNTITLGDGTTVGFRADCVPNNTQTGYFRADWTASAEL
jgi:hypothetical protein